MTDRTHTTRGARRDHEFDPYEILQVSPHASAEVIHAAYRALARGAHPDVNSGRDVTGGMRRLNAAYETLRDPARRTAYDARTRALRSSELRQMQLRQRPSHVGPHRRAVAVDAPPPSVASFRGGPSRAAMLATMTVIVLAMVALVIAVWAVTAVLEDAPTPVSFGHLSEVSAQPFLNPR